MVSKGNHPQMAQLFRLVKYYNLPRSLFYHHFFQGVPTSLVFSPDSGGHQSDHRQPPGSDCASLAGLGVRQEPWKKRNGGNLTRCPMIPSGNVNIAIKNDHL